MASIDSQQFKKLIREHCSTQEQFCEKFGTNRATVRRWMVDGRLPDNKLEELANFFSVMRSDLQTPGPVDSKLQAEIGKEVEQVIKESGEDLSYSDYLFWVNFIYTRYRQLGMDLEALKRDLRKAR